MSRLTTKINASLTGTAHHIPAACSLWATRTETPGHRIQFAKSEFLGVFLTSTHAPTKRPASRHQSVPRAAHPQEATKKSN